MLKDSLYNIKKITVENNSVKAIVALEEQHEIFRAHFPSQPVLPGACMLQMTREIAETFLKKELQLARADDIRFLSIIQPSGTDLEFYIQYSYKENSVLNISARITVNDVTCYKLKALFNIQS